MVIFGITGGSGTGKSTVSKMLSAQGVHVIDTDLIARKVVSLGSDCLAELVDFFGDGILLDDGSLNRRKLAGIAFSSENKTRKLNEITHKHIKAEVLADIASSNADFIGIDGAVIIGSEIETLCEFIISVVADRDVRIERIKVRDGISDEQALQRLDAQPSDEFYIENSLYIIYNNMNLSQLERDVLELFEKIKGEQF